MINQIEYKKVWVPFENKFEFFPAYSGDSPGIVEPTDSVTFLIETSQKDVIDKLDALFHKAFATLSKTNMYALDWQHENYEFDPKEDYLNLPIRVFPDGDYYIIISKNFDFGTFGHPWRGTICVFGQELINLVQHKMPIGFNKVIRVGGKKIPLDKPTKFPKKSRR